MSPEKIRCRRIFLVATLCALCMAAGVTIADVHPAAADQVADLNAKAKSISEQLVQEQLQIEAYQQQYSVVSQRVADDVQAMAAIRQQINNVEAQSNTLTRLLRQQALAVYMGGGDELSGADAVFFEGTGESAQIVDEYSALAAANIQSVVSQLGTARRVLDARQSTLQVVQSRDQADQQRQATALTQAGSSEQHITTLQAQVVGQLAAAVAHQAAAQSAAAAAAVSAAQNAAAHRAPAASPPTVGRSPGPTSAGGGAPSQGSPAPAPAPPPASGSDPVLNSYLQCVVQAESGGNYGAVSPDGMYMGAFQFTQATWNFAAQAAGRPDLVGVPPNLASKADQDAVAVALYALDGEQPWLGDRCTS
jgi:hypothetical protein